MARTRRAREEIADSWEDVGNSVNSTPDDNIYGEDEERDELGSEYQARSGRRDDHVEAPRRRSLRSSVEPELVMPSSPDAAPRTRLSTTQRANTPHFRLNQRSLTSDAGEIRKKQRTTTPRMRMSDRSMTSDAGRMNGSGLKEQHDADYDSDEEEVTGSQYPAMIWRRIVRPLLRYFTDVVGYALHQVKPMLGWALLIYALAAVLVFGTGFLTNSINNALSPVCRLPFTSHLSFCPSKSAGEVHGTAEFDKLVQAQDAFQDVLASTSIGATLPLDMKRSEASIRDLKHVVEYSSLPSKNELVFEFGGFIDTARQASQDLSRFNSRIGRAVDHILSTNRWTLSVIDGVSETEASRGAISKWMGKNLNIFSPFQPVSLSRDVLLDQYLRHTSAVEEQILNLIAEAYALRDILENLDGRLDVIAGIATRDGIKTEMNKDELFATLWTKLGGNRSSVSKINQQLELLKNVSAYRRQAWGHVTATLLKLQEIQASLEDLRERVAMPETVGTAKVPLDVHIENINRGIERLENQRDSSRKLEAENYARIVGKAEANEKKSLGGKEL
ncbi:unnamed protein product [Zymoseptoria tritici ST99CH_1A5]|nr:unnamed protein product [Zymoseptoria tritici ST99CH_1E4]SMY19060.1 unnamed protein product [Zymoseptoria tritici ST99CH_1A5]